MSDSFPSDDEGGAGVGLADPGSDDPLAPRGREYFDWILGWRQHEDAEAAATWERVDAARAAAAEARAARAATAERRRVSRAQRMQAPIWDDFGETDAPAPGDDERTAAEIAALANRATGELDVVPGATGTFETPGAAAAPRGRNYFAWVLGWRDEQAAASIGAVSPVPDEAEEPYQGTAETDDLTWLTEPQSPGDVLAESEPVQIEMAEMDPVAIAPAEAAPYSPVEELPWYETPVEEAPVAPAEPEPEPLAWTPDAVEVSNRPTGEFELPVAGDTVARSAAVTGEFDAIGALAAAEVDADFPPAEPSFITKKFHAFYGEIVRFRNQKSPLAGAFATAIADVSALDQAVAGKPDPEHAAVEQSTKFRDLLQLQAAEAKWLGGDKSGRFSEAEYAMVAFADETFATSEWPGRSAWAGHSLEAKLYETTIAGTAIFRAIDALILEQRTVANRELAVVYLMIIAAGFQGAYRDSGRDDALLEYRRRLFEYAHGRDAGALYAADRVIFPQAAAHTVPGRAVPRVSMAQRWGIVLVVLVIFYFLGARALWVRTTADLGDVIQRIESVR